MTQNIVPTGGEEMPPNFTLEKIFVEVPLHDPKPVSDLFISQQKTHGLEWPSEYRDYCAHEHCQGIRRHYKISVRTFDMTDQIAFHYGAYGCADCKVTLKVLGLRTERMPAAFDGICTKIYQEPPFGRPVPKRLFEIIGEENREPFLQARRSIARGLGIGAYAYYRRIIENNKLHLIESILDVAEKTGAPSPQRDILKAAAQERQFSKAIDTLREVGAIPPVLLINGHNPLLLLHDLLSEGIHGLTDHECLERAMEAEIVLSELARLMQIALSERKEIHSAINSIMARKKR